ncbi:hypothetical protein V5O48_009222 [Marasmius crinis-equi]|uniref:BTB domain-containing protein n=1 Tax=Marasmius crinis-equi TaxID=585013 RepID=A0ABR3FBW6_9AGAR
MAAFTSSSESKPLCMNAENAKYGDTYWESLYMVYPMDEDLDWEQAFNFALSHSDTSHSDSSSYGGSQSPTALDNPHSKSDEYDDRYDIENREGTTTSTAFYPGADTYYLPSSIVLVSLDLVCFHVHPEVLRSVTNNHFNSLLPARQKGVTFIDVPEQSSILNIILHLAYGISVTRFSPTFEMLSEAVYHLERYGIIPKVEITPTSALHATLMLYAPSHPLALYTLASKYDIFSLASSTSPHLLSLSLDKITDAMAEAMGPVYLARLLGLQQRRMDTLKELLSKQPPLHSPTRSCDSNAQKSVTKAWTLASAYLVWEARPDLSPTYLNSVLGSLPEHTTCESCKKALTDRINAVATSWQAVKASSCP